MGTQRRRKQKIENTAHLEPRVFPSQAEARAAAQASGREPGTADVWEWEYDANGRPTGWVVRVEEYLSSYYLHEDGGFIR